MKRLGAITNRNCVVLTEQETRRLRRFIAKVGRVGLAMDRLGLCSSTFDAARGYGRMQATTRERVLAALAAVEAQS